MKKRNIFGSALSLAMVVIMLLGLGSVTAFAYISEQATKSTGVWTEISESEDRYLILYLNNPQ